MNQPNNNIFFDNYGKVISLNGSPNGAQAIDWNAITTGSNTLHNYHTGLIEAHCGDAVRPGLNGSVINEGTIKAIPSRVNEDPPCPPSSDDATVPKSDGVNGQTNSGIVISNNGNGLIEGGRHGITAGDDDANVTLTVTNQHSATIQGDDGAGINIDGFDVNEVVTIQNDGTIKGNGMTRDGDGVDVDGIVNLTNTGVIQSLNSPSNQGASEGITTGGGTINNSGTIEGSVASGNTTAVGRGITIAGVDKDTNGNSIPVQAPYAATTITNSGLIKGDSDSAIIFSSALASEFNHTINNKARGTIEGGGNSAAAIQTAADNDTVNNAGDVIANASGKAIDLGDGDDTLNITGGTIHGNISGGSGRNTCTIDPRASNLFTYTGAISDFDSVEIKRGVVSFFGASSYSGSTTISGGTLIAANSKGSATGSGAVQVTGGTLGGEGSIGGPVTIGGASGSGALAPGVDEEEEATLTIQRTLRFQTGGTYVFKANHNSADQVIANGVTIAKDAKGATVRGIIRERLHVGTTFTIIDNTATTPIVGTFANLGHNSIIEINGNKLKASYEGGDGNNDLTLTVVP
jgi:autotransporter-associated beta strand protein